MIQFRIPSGTLPVLIASMAALTISMAISSGQGGQNAVETESAKVWVGKKAKGFTLPGVDGKPVDVAKSIGRRPVVLIFYRGVW